MDGLVNSLGQDVMLMLGPFRFAVTTAAYQEFSRQTEYRWAAQQRFGQLDALQFTGRNSETVTLPGVIYPSFRGGRGQIDRLRQMADVGIPYLMVDAFGNMKGMWVIEKIDEKQSSFYALGLPRKQEFTLSLRLFSDGITVS